MPYIDAERRKRLDDDVNAIIAALAEGGARPGDVNYVITRILDALSGSEIRYETINTVLGILSAVSLEFYRRIAAPYEDNKKRENGDVYGNPL